jgi:hypothetical protein
MTVAFEGMTLTRSEGNTALTGNVRDQAQLQGLLQRVSNLGLTLLQARAVPARCCQGCGSEARVITEGRPAGSCEVGGDDASQRSA